MAYFEDLSNYVYIPQFNRSGTKSVGWLARGHEFATATPTQEILDRLWLFCSISIASTRGVHDCEFCPGRCAYQAERNGQRLLLGTSEIRVFSHDERRIYAAPTLIYHYVAAHHYKPPEEFLEALRQGPRPPNQEYFDTLARLNLEWRRTSSGPPRGRIFLCPDAGPHGRNYLTKLGTLSDIKSTNLKLEEGLVVPFYRPGAHEKDYLLFEGTIYFDAQKEEWYAIVDAGSYRHESDPISQC